MKIFFLIVSILIFSSLGGWLYLDKKVANFIFEENFEEKVFSIQKGEGVREIGQKLEEEKLIKKSWYFIYYIWRNGLKADLKAGDYLLKPSMTLKEIAEKMIDGKVEKEKEKIDKITIPEGYRNTKIVDLLKKDWPNLADEFQKISDCQCLQEEVCECDFFSEQFAFLKEIPKGVDLEGYFFPDTYFLAKNETGKSLAHKMLMNFQNKIEKLISAKEQSKLSWHEIITLASIVEREAVTVEDKKMVAGIFLNRLKKAMPLQSCATIAYIKNEDKIKFSFNDTRLKSPYNTYINLGLPPGPIANPGLEAIEAVLFPTQTDYYFFLSNPETGQMTYSRTMEEQSKNKFLNGLD